MTTFLNNELYPLTSRMAFIKKDLSITVNEFIKWQEPLIAKNNNTLTKTIINDNLKNTILKLCPLTTIEKRKFLFIPTCSEWVAYFDNGHTGTDRTIPEVLGSNLNCEMIYMTIDTTTNENIFEYYKMIDGKFDLRRSIAVIKEGKWKFHEYGGLLPFEELDRYKTRIVKEKFTIELLEKYLKSYNIDVFNESFYDTIKGSIIVNKIGPQYSNTKELTLIEAKTFFKE